MKLKTITPRKRKPDDTKNWNLNLKISSQENESARTVVEGTRSSSQNLGLECLGGGEGGEGGEGVEGFTVAQDQVVVIVKKERIFIQPSRVIFGISYLSLCSPPALSLFLSLSLSPTPFSLSERFGND